jgi:hypothetical protein
LLFTVKRPVKDPAVCGANVICSVRDWPTGRVIGRLAGPSVKLVPLIPTEFTVTGEVPDEVNVSPRPFDEPWLILPKLRLEELIDSCGVEAVPVPLRTTVEVIPSVQLVEIARLEVAAPAVWGAKVTGMARLWPGGRLTGSDIAPTEKPALGRFMELIVIAVFPDDVKVNDIIFDDPLATLP